ncbi:MAG: DUF255 domain-containing protein [Nocardioides sp.]
MWFSRRPCGPPQPPGTSLLHHRSRRSRVRSGTWPTVSSQPRRHTSSSTRTTLSTGGVGKRGLRRSAQKKRPVLLSVGYAACRWCHDVQPERSSTKFRRNRRSEGVRRSGPVQGVSPLDADFGGSCILSCITQARLAEGDLVPRGSGKPRLM